MGIRILIAAAVLLAAPAAGAKDGQVLLNDDFSSYAKGTDGSPVWSVEGGEARVTAEGYELRNSGTDSFALRGAAAGSEEWSDYRLSFRVRLVSPGEDWRDGVWVGVRYAGGLNAYVLGLTQGHAFLYKVLQDESVTGNKPLAQVDDPRAGLRDGEWHALEVTLRGESIAVALDGGPLLAVKDDNPDHLAPLLRGGIALGARRCSTSKRDTVALFKDVRVASLGEPRESPEDAALRRSLASMPRPWTRREVWPTYPEYLDAMHGWAERHPDRITVEEAGRSLEGRPILVARVTDRSTPDDDKHVILVTALDSGGERSGSTAALATIEWLLGDSPLARESLRHHVVVVMPVPNPYGYEHGIPTNSKGINPYAGGRARSDAWDVAGLDLRSPGEADHLAAVKAVVDRYQPEFQMDLHGVPLRYAGQMVQPSVGSAFSNIANRPWDWRLVEYLIAFAGKAGYGFSRMEVDAQKLFCGESMAPFGRRFWMGRPFFYTAHYGYTKYHTMPCTSETAWEQGSVELIKGLLDFGNRQFRESPVPRLPVDRASVLEGYSVCAYGATARERRESRVELWQRQEEIGQGFLYNYTDGREMLVCTLGSEAYDLLRGEEPGPMLDAWGFLRRIRQVPTLQAAPIESFVLAGPQRRIYFEPPTAPSGPRGPFRKGLAIEFPVYYPKLELLDLCLNGRRLEQSRTDGYQCWYSSWEGYTLVRVNVPPEVLAKQSIFVITCAYKPGAQRTYGWQPPKPAAR